MIEVYEVTTTSEQDNGEEELVKLFLKTRVEFSWVT